MREDLDKYFSGELAQEEKEIFLQDVVSDDLLKEEFIKTQNIIGLSDFSSIHGDYDMGQSGLLKFKQQVKKKHLKRYVFNIMKYAAVITVAVLSTWFVSGQYFSKSLISSYSEIEVPQGHQAHVRLEDGTTVWLKSRSKLTYPNSFTGDKRVVVLDGEGFFSVQKNDKKPFIVKTSRYNVQVLGTKFNVFNYSESAVFETTLLEGAVKVFKADNEKDAIKLLPNEQVVMKNGMLNKRVIENQDLSLWQNGYAIFDNEQFENIIRKLELYYNVKFVIRNEKALQNTYTGNFNLNDSIEKILDALQKVQKFSCTMSSDKKIIYVN